MNISSVQRLLKALGFDPGPIDGVWGEKTETALRRALESKNGETTDLEDFWKELPNFRREEFRCPCGSCGGYPVEPERGLAELAQEVRDFFGAPMHISSGVRCRARNRAVGGVENSRHLLGKAMDFAVEGRPAREVKNHCDTLIAAGKARYCYCIDQSFVHLDVE